MNNIQKLIVVAVILLVLILLIRKKTKAGDHEALAEQPPLFLTVGSQGDVVKQLQIKLNEIIREAVKRNVTLMCTYQPGMDPWTVGQLDVDGRFGPRTACALKAISGGISIYSNQIESLKLDMQLGAAILDRIKWE